MGKVISFLCFGNHIGFVVSGNFKTNTELWHISLLTNMLNKMKILCARTAA